MARLWLALGIADRRVRVATTANITISTALNNGDTLDGVTLATGDRVLVKNQSSASQNGIYVVGASPARANDYSTWAAHPGAIVSVAEGTAGADTIWQCTSNEGGTLESTSITWARVNHASGIANTAAGNIAATTVQAAIDELDSEKAALAGATFTGNLTIEKSTPNIILTHTDNGTDHRMQGASNLRFDADFNNETASTLMTFFIDGSERARLTAGGGLWMPSATGGDKGAGTINAVAVYDDNVLLTCMAMTRKFVETGVFDDDDVAEWDARVPDHVEPARTERVPVMETVEVLRPVPDGDGSLVLRRVEERRQATEPVPVYAENGKDGIGMIEEPVFETVEVPETVTPRRHEVARLFKRMIDDGFDPRDPAAYIAKMKDDGALPAMPTVADWEHNSLSSGELFCRLWLATELLALAFAGLAARVAALEA
jgi:hypothetical protein